MTFSPQELRRQLEAHRDSITENLQAGESKITVIKALRQKLEPRSLALAKTMVEVVQEELGRAKGLRVYVASSWRNSHQPAVVKALREHGHEVYDFRNPEEGDHGFHWREISPDWESWTAAQFRDALGHPLAQRSFKSDHQAMEWAQVCVLVLPSGVSSHVEAGWFCGKGKPVLVLLDDSPEPEMMYLEATALCLHLEEVKEKLDEIRNQLFDRGLHPPREILGRYER